MGRTKRNRIDDAITHDGQDPPRDPLVVDADDDEDTFGLSPVVPAQPKRGRGRPKGSKDSAEVTSRRASRGRDDLTVACLTGVMQELSDDERRFVHMTTRTKDPLGSYVSAGYASEHVSAGDWHEVKKLLRRFLKDRRIQAALKYERERLSQRDIRDERLLDELAAIAFSDPRDLVTLDGDLIPTQELPDRVAAAISEMKVVERIIPGTDGVIERTTTYKFAGKQKALDMIAEIKGVRAKSKGGKGVRKIRFAFDKDKGAIEVEG